KCPRARSPFFHRLTSGPASSITPQNSCPITHGVGRATPTQLQSPVHRCQSVRQMPFASTRTMTPPGGHSGSGMSRTTSGWRLASTTAARMEGGLHPPPSSRKRCGARPRKLEVPLAAIGALRREPVTPGTIDALRQALRGRSSHVAAKASQVIAELGLRVLAADAAAAFDRFRVNPVKSDPRCRAKVEIARALYELGADPAAGFPRGVRHRQMEPVVAD